MVESHDPREAFWDYSCVAGKLLNLRTRALPKHQSHTVREYIDNLQAQINDLHKAIGALTQANGELYKCLDETKRTTR